MIVEMASQSKSTQEAEATIGVLTYRQSRILQRQNEQSLSASDAQPRCSGYFPAQNPRRKDRPQPPLYGEGRLSKRYGCGLLKLYDVVEIHLTNDPHQKVGGLIALIGVASVDKHSIIYTKYINTLLTECRWSCWEWPVMAAEAVGVACITSRISLIPDSMPWSTSTIASWRIESSRSQGRQIAGVI